MSKTKTESQTPYPQRFSGKWKTKQLEDLSDINPQNFSSSTNPEYKFNYISLEQVDSGKLLGYSEEIFRTAPSRAQRVLQNGDVLMSTVRPNLWHISFFTTKYQMLSVPQASLFSVQNTTDPILIFYSRSYLAKA